MSKNSKPKNNTPKNKVMVVKIDVYDDGSVRVRDFPDNFPKINGIMNAANFVLAYHFFKGIQEGRYNPDGTPKSDKIIVPTPRIIQ